MMESDQIGQGQNFQLSKYKLLWTTSWVGQLKLTVLAQWFYQSIKCICVLENLKLNTTCQTKNDMICFAQSP